MYFFSLLADAQVNTLQQYAPDFSHPQHYLNKMNSTHFLLPDSLLVYLTFFFSPRSDSVFKM